MASDARAVDPVQDEFRRACADLDRRLRAGAPVAAEEWVAAGGPLAADADLAVELIFTEYVTREELGENPAADEFYARFPAHADRLRRLFGVDQLLHESVAGTKNRPSDTPAARPAPAPPPGRAAGPYELLERIGSGGMGVVYRGWHPVLRREVAVKLLRGGGADRLAREAEAVARLNHPNIVQLFEVGEQDGQPFLALEYVPGPNLRDRLAGRALPPAAAAALVETLARAVHHAHERGVVHRDLKPANILLQSAECRVQSAESDPDLHSALCTLHSAFLPKVTDFGLAALADADGGTGTGHLIGTAAYMPPEQAEARPGWVGPGVDVYALGAILYECLTGRPPFLADTPLETIRQAVHDEPVPPRRLAPHVPRDLETVALKCLAKTAARRYPTAADLADDLARVRAGRPVAARRATWVERAAHAARRRPAVAAAAAVAVVALVALVGGWASFTRDLRAERDAKADETTRATGARADAEKARADAEKARIDADRDRDTAVGERRRAERLLDRTHDLLYAAGVARAGALADANPHAAAQFLHDPEAVRPDRLEFAGRLLAARLRPPVVVQAHARGINALAASRDGALVVTAGADGAVRGWDGATGAPRFDIPAAHAGAASAVAVAADGSRFATGGTDGKVKLWNPADPTRPTVLAALPGTVLAVALSADGKWVAAAATPPLHGQIRPGDDGTVGVWDAATGVREFDLPRRGAAARALAFAPDGKTLVAGYAIPPVAGDVVVWDLGTRERRFTRLLPAFAAAVAFAPNGRAVAAAAMTSGGGGVGVWATDGEPLGPIAGVPTVWSVAFAPDSLTLAVGQQSGLVTTWAVDGGTRRGILGEPKPTPPRAAVAATFPTSTFSHPRMLAAEIPGSAAGVAFADRGRTLVAAGSDGALRVWTADTARLRRDLVPDGYDVRCAAPFGADVLVGCGDGRVRRWNPRTGAVEVAAENLGGAVVALAVAPDGRRVGASVGAKGGGGAVHLFDPATGAVAWTAAGSGRTRFHLAFTPDGAGLAGSSMQELVGWDAATGRAGPAWTTPGRVWTVAPGPAAGLVWVAATDGAVAVDPRTGREVRRWPAAAPFTEAAFDPTGRLVAVRRPVATSVTALAIHPADPAAAPVVIGGEQNVVCPTFSPDGRTLAACDRGRVRLWHAPTGQELLSLDAGGAGQSVAFAPDGTGLVALVGPRRVAYWGVAPERE